ncbi:MAG: HEAT repeat domain-containing protein [Pirellulales bacterium]|nr:HEAT repeat domain-containing protein [Pirellulales bacterium]
MFNKNLLAIVKLCEWLLVGGSLCVVSVALRAGDHSALDGAIQALAKLEPGQDLSVLNPIEQAVVQSRADEQARMDIENRLVAILRGTATDDAKAYACRQLGIVGSDESVPVLAELLPNPRLSHMACYALEDIGSPAALRSLRDMLGKTEGREKIGIAISLGRLADPDAVLILSDLLHARDNTLAEVAVTALGRIGTLPAAEALRSYAGAAPPEFDHVVADAICNAAELLCRRGDPAAAVRLYESLQSAESERIRAAAFRGLMVAKPSESIRMVIAGLASEEPWQRAVAADYLVDLKQQEAIRAIASAIPELPLSGKIAALVSLQDRADPALRAAALELLDHPDTEIRIHALKVLRMSGTAHDVTELAHLATAAEDDRIRAAAFETLRLMPARGTNQALIGWMQTEGNLSPAIVQCALARRSPMFLPVFLEAAKDSHPAIRIEAFHALEIMATERDIHTLIELLCRSSEGEEREAAGRAVWISCQKIPDPTQRPAPLLAAFQKADAAGQCAILPSLARMGGEESLRAVHSAMQSTDRSVRDAGYRALANWPDASVADELFEIARHGNLPAYRVWALRAYARVISLPNDCPPQQTFDRLKQALDLATRIEDKKLILSRFGSVRTIETLALLRDFVDDPELQGTVVAAIFEAAKGLSQTDPEPARAALEAIRSLTQDEALRQQIPKVIQDIDARKQDR